MTTLLADRQIQDTLNLAASPLDLSRIMEWDLSHVSEYVVEKQMFDEVTASEVVTEYRRFVWLSLRYPTVETPVSVLIDQFWHAHILFTRDYTDMCLAAAGNYLHHRPGLLDRRAGTVSPKRPCDAKLALYRAAFGEPNPRFWTIAGDCRPCDTDPNEFRLAAGDCRPCDTDPNEVRVVGGDCRPCDTDPNGVGPTLQ